MILIDQFKELPGVDIHLANYAMGYINGSIRHAFVEFSWDCLGGCWLGKYGLVCLSDGTEVERLPTCARLDAEQDRMSPPSTRKPRKNALPRQRWSDAWASVEKPYGVRLFGNDDSTWGMWFATKEEAERVFEEIIAFEPWDYEDIMSMYKWAYTN